MVYVINNHLIEVSAEGLIGACDCEDYRRMKYRHKGWCKHRLAVAIIVGAEIVRTIDVLTKRLASARELLRKEDT